MSYSLSLPTVPIEQLISSTGRSLIDRVKSGRERILISTNGKPDAVIIPVSDYEKLEEMQEEAGQELMKIIEEGRKNVAAAGLSEDEIDAIIAQAVTEVRAGNYR